jgi:ribosome-binding protein aMBF1 (putative translation factor)
MKRQYHKHADKRKELLKDPEIRKAYEEELSMLTIAHRIAELREQANMTQAQLAARIHTKQQVVSRLEDEQHIPSFATLWKVAHAFGKRLEINMV